MINDIEEDLKKIIYKIACKYRNHYPIEDLYQAGAIGVIKASKNYKEGYNTKFTTYAYNYILGEIIDFINKDRNIKVSSDYLKIYKRYEQMKDILTQKLSRVPSRVEIANYMNIEEELLNDVIICSRYELSLDNVVSEENDNSYYEMIEDKRNNMELKIEINSEIDKLPETEKQLIKYRYQNNYTQSETAKILNINQVQVSRLEKKAKERIRTAMYS